MSEGQFDTKHTSESASLDAIPLEKKGWFDTAFTLCYKKDNHCQLWVCERGFDSVKTVDMRAFELKKTHPDVSTTFFPGYITTPTFLRRQYLKHQLVPKVVVHK